MAALPQSELREQHLSPSLDQSIRASARRYLQSVVDVLAAEDSALARHRAFKALGLSRVSVCVRACVRVCVRACVPEYTKIKRACLSTLK